MAWAHGDQSAARPRSTKEGVYPWLLSSQDDHGAKGAQPPHSKAPGQDRADYRPWSLAGHLPARICRPLLCVSLRERAHPGRAGCAARHEGRPDEVGRRSCRHKDRREKVFLFYRPPSLEKAPGEAVQEATKEAPGALRRPPPLLSPSLQSDRLQP